MHCTMTSTGLRLGVVRPLTTRASIARPVARRITTVKASAKSENTTQDLVSKAMVGFPALLAPLILDSSAALAQNREYGIIEGQIFSLMHPAIMFFLFGASVYSGYLGFQWRHTRELAAQIKDLKSQKGPATVGADGQTIAAPPSPLDSQISELEKVRMVEIICIHIDYMYGLFELNSSLFLCFLNLSLHFDFV